jgi:hypothetical protein
MNDNLLSRNGEKVDSLYRAIRDSQAIELIPELVKKVLNEEMWREHLFQKTGQTFIFETFLAFVETHPPDGLGIKVERLFKLCVDDPIALDMIDQAILKDHADATERGETTKRPPISTARQAGIRKLRELSENNENIAELRKSVMAGEIGVSAALSKAGLRPRRATIPKDVSKAAEALRSFYSPTEFQKLVEALIAEYQANA